MHSFCIAFVCVCAVMHAKTLYITNMCLEPHLSCCTRRRMKFYNLVSTLLFDATVIARRNASMINSMDLFGVWFCLYFLLQLHSLGQLWLLSMHTRYFKLIDIIQCHGCFIFKVTLYLFMHILCLQAARYNDGTAENFEIAKKFELKAERCDSIAYWITVVFFAIAFACTFFGTVVIITITRIHAGLAVETGFIVNC